MENFAKKFALGVALAFVLFFAYSLFLPSENFGSPCGVNSNLTGFATASEGSQLPVIFGIVSLAVLIILSYTYRYRKRISDLSG